MRSGLVHNARHQGVVTHEVGDRTAREELLRGTGDWDELRNRVAVRKLRWISHSRSMAREG